jgi:hypothetical protein
MEFNSAFKGLIIYGAVLRLAYALIEQSLIQRVDSVLYLQYL